MHNIGDGLGVSGGAGATAPDGVMDLRQLVRDSVRDIGARRGARVGAQNHALIKIDGHSWGADFLERVVRWWQGKESGRTWRFRG